MVPTYIRSELKKKLGIVIDEKGNKVIKEENEEEEENNPNSKLLNDKSQTNKIQKQYTPIGQYKPTGNLVYSPEIFEKIEKRVS